MMLQLWQMWPLEENISCLIPKWQLARKRNLQANLQQQQYSKQMLWSTSLLPHQKVKSWTLVILFYLNVNHASVLWLRCPGTPIWRRRFPEHTSSFTHHSGMTLLTQQVFKFSHDSEFGIISSRFHQVQHSPSPPRKPRTSSPLIHVWFQSLLLNTFCISLTIILRLADHALSELSGQPNIAIPSSSSQPFVPVASNLDEIRLKQVNTFSFGRFHYTSYPHQPS